MKRPREDELPPYDDDDAHRREVVCRLNGIPAAFIAAIDKLDAKADPEAIAGAVFAAYREAAIDAAAYHPQAPHRAAAKSSILAKIKALEAIKAGLLLLRSAQGGGYGADRVNDLVEYRGGIAVADRLDAVGAMEAVEADLAQARANSDVLHGSGKGRLTRLRLFAGHLAPIYVEATGKAVRGRSSAYEDNGEPTGFAAFLAAACELVAGVIPSRSLADNIAKELAKN